MAEEIGELTAEQMLAAAEKFDSQLEQGIGSPQFELPEPAPPSEEPEAETEPEEERVEEQEESSDDADGDSSATGEGPEPEAEAQDKPEPDKKQSRWEKNESRKSSSWKQINEEKEKLRHDKDELERRASEIEESRKAIESGQSYRDEKGHTAEDYDAAAKELMEDGESDLASKAEERAAEVRNLAKKDQIKSQEKKAQDAWESKRVALMEQNPELKDNNSELVVTSNHLLKQYPILTYNPDGLEYAVEVAKLKIKSDAGEKAQAEVKKLSKKLKEYEKKTSVAGGFTPTRPEGEQSFDDMDASDQESFLRRAAMMADETM